MPFIKSNSRWGMPLAIALVVTSQLPFNVALASIDEETEVELKELDKAPEKQQEQCLQEQLLISSAETTLREIRLLCADRVRAQLGLEEDFFEVDPVVEEYSEELPTDKVLLGGRAQAIRDAASNPFTLASHKTNYILPFTYNPSPEKGGLSDYEGEGKDLDNIEVQFQLSVQVPVWRGFLGSASFMSVAYTNRSFWQAYNSDNSSPFRETNHEPELILTWLNDWSLFGWQNVANQIAFNHQSNGRNEPYSRSWNRVYANFLFEKDNFSLGIKPWYRLPEDRDDDDNPDIEHYMGHFELGGRYRDGDHTIAVMVRNNLRSDNHGAFELTWGFPLGDRVDGYIRYFNGYGESLIDYDESVQTLGFGFTLAQGF
ncbi:phospholipase A [Microbulbifer sp. THAF38]|uniref:phospholipase A n=1 Tax=Microbulbifer sp. THAF38 TaxID=2587856 RepID=UPI0012A7E9FB|nr:phospholipase A [Microbulbifer sp. THAF38]QFT56120.1 Phospholipase A1 precursor [Microbulbifer sp. THAF38]